MDETRSDVLNDTHIGDYRKLMKDTLADSIRCPSPQLQLGKEEIERLVLYRQTDHCNNGCFSFCIPVCQPFHITAEEWKSEISPNPTFYI